MKLPGRFLRGGADAPPPANAGGVGDRPGVPRGRLGSRPWYALFTLAAFLLGGSSDLQLAAKAENTVRGEPRDSR